MDLISRQAAIDVIESFDVLDGYQDKVELASRIEALPAEPQRMRAQWIATTSLQEGQITWRDYKCSNCSHHRGKPMNFCEVCGAKMER